jgi:ATP-dependent RNA helicase RhlE
VEVTRSGAPAEGVQQALFVIKPEEKYALLLTLLAEYPGSTLVFSSTRDRTEKVQALLKREGYKTAAIHSERTQNQRKQALAGFRDGQYRCLVATEVAARGLDIEDVEHVINFDLPHSPEDYVHRIGRTARAGATGRATTFVTHEDSRFISNIERVVRRDIPRLPVPREHPAFVAELARFAEVKEVSDARHGKRKPQTRPDAHPTRGQKPQPAKTSAGRPEARKGSPGQKPRPGGRPDARPPARGKAGQRQDAARPNRGERGNAGRSERRPGARGPAPKHRR